MRTRATLVRSTKPYGLSLGTAAGAAGGGSAVFSRPFRVAARRVPMDSGGVNELFPLPAREPLSDGAMLLRGFARDEVSQLLADLATITEIGRAHV